MQRNVYETEIMMSETRTAKHRLDKTDRFINLGLFFVTLAILGTLVLQLNVAPVLDEVGTLANTAFLTGMDWTECVRSMGNHYYKAGMPIFYLPFFLLFENPFVIYKLSLFVNEIFMSLIPVFAYTILRKHLLSTADIKNRTVWNERVLPAAIALIVGFIPSVDLHSMYTKSDPMLIFLAWPIMLCIFEGLDAAEENRRVKSILISVLAGFLSVYAFFSHTRGVVVIIALVMTNACMHLFVRRKPFKWIPFAASLGVFLLLEKITTNYFVTHVIIYGADHGTLESAGLGALKQLFSKAGILTMIKLVIGWFYNVFVASYGMIIIGLLVAIYFIFKALAYKKAYGTREAIPYKETAAAAFSFLNFCGSFAMGALFFFRPVHEFFTGVEVSRGDRIIFGRYTVCTVGPLVMIALFYLLYRSDILGFKTKVITVAIYAVIFLLFVFYLSPWLDGVSVNSRYFISLTTFLEYPYRGGTSNPMENLCEALRWAGEIAGIVLLVILRLSVSLSDNESEKRRCVRISALAAVAIVYSLTIMSVNYYNNRLARDSFLYGRVKRNSALLNEIAANTDIEERFPYVLVIDCAINIKNYQMASMEYSFGNYKTLAAKQDNCFIYARKDRFLEYYCDDDYYVFKKYNYNKNLQDIVYVKGHELAEALEAAGYKMKKYTGPLIEKKTH